LWRRSPKDARLAPDKIANADRIHLVERGVNDGGVLAHIRSGHLKDNVGIS
jgi:hypothetical protein